MTIRSFVLRQGRMTPGQERAFTELWPKYGIDLHEGDVINASTVFGDDRDLVVEIGFGNGETLVEMASAEPEKGFIGIEVHRPGVGHALLKIEQAGIENLRLIRHDAVEVLRDYVPESSLSRVQVYFPDPWPICIWIVAVVILCPVLWATLVAGLTGEWKLSSDTGLL